MSNLFKSCIGEKVKDLAPLVLKAHTGKTRLVGIATVEHGNFASRILCKVFGMPPAVSNCNLTVMGEHDSKIMLWNRRFDDFAMNSVFIKEGNYLAEKLGHIRMYLELDVVNQVLTYRLVKTRVFGIPLPKFLSPRVIATEEEFEGKYRFSVSVEMPLVGLIVRYFGDMQVEALVE